MEIYSIKSIWAQDGGGQNPHNPPLVVLLGPVPWVGLGAGHRVATRTERLEEVVFQAFGLFCLLFLTPQ